LCDTPIRSLHHKLCNHPELLAEYNIIIQDQLKKKKGTKRGKKEKLAHHAAFKKDWGN